MVLGLFFHNNLISANQYLQIFLHNLLTLYGSFLCAQLQGTQNHNPHQAMNRDLNLQSLLQRQMNPYHHQRGSYAQAPQNDLLHALGNQQQQGHGMNHANSLIQQLQHQQFQNQQPMGGMRQQQANFGLSAYDDIRQQFEQKMQQIREEQERQRQKQQHEQQIQQHLQKLQQQQKEQQLHKNPMALLQEDYEVRKNVYLFVATPKLLT